MKSKKKKRKRRWRRRGRGGGVTAETVIVLCNRNTPKTFFCRFAFAKSLQIAFSLIFSILLSNPFSLYPAVMSSSFSIFVNPSYFAVFFLPSCAPSYFLFVFCFFIFLFSSLQSVLSLSKFLLFFLPLSFYRIDFNFFV